MPQEEEEERERHGHEDVAVECPRLAEQHERAAVARRERDGRDRRHEHGRSQPGGAKEREARLIDDHEGDRRDRTRLVQHHLRRTDSADLRDERKERVPQGEGVSRVEAAV